MQVNWYRNASEKDANKPHGTGELLEVLHPAQASESIAIIVDTEGNFVEKLLSLIKQAEESESLRTDLDIANQTIKQLDLEHAEHKVLLEETGKQLITAKEEVKELHGELTIALDEIAKLKKPKPKPVTPKK